MGLSKKNNNTWREERGSPLSSKGGGGKRRFLWQKRYKSKEEKGTREEGEPSGSCVGRKSLLRGEICDEEKNPVAVVD